MSAHAQHLTTRILRRVMMNDVRVIGCTDVFKIDAKTEPLACAITGANYIENTRINGKWPLR